MLFCIVILSGFLGAIVASPTIFDDMSSEEKRHFFGSSDDVIPEFKLVRLSPPSRMARSTDGSFTMDLEFGDQRVTTNLALVSDKILMGRSTAIWIATSYGGAFNNIIYKPDPTVLERMGDVSFYQDVDRGSALTYHAGEKFTGIICQYYGVKPLPEGFAETSTIEPMLNDAVETRSSGSEEDTAQESGDSVVHVIYKIKEVPQEKFIFRSNRNTPVNFEPTHNRERRQDSRTVELQEPPKAVYPRLLVSLDYSALAGFGDTVKLVSYLMAFWNCVDMIYRKLSNPAVRLNIVGFIIAADESAAPYLETVPKLSQLDPRATYSDATLQNIRRHFYSENQRFDPDSYDIVMAMTRTQMWGLRRIDNDPIWRWHRILGYGWPEWSSNACKKQQLPYRSKATRNVGIATFDTWLGGVAVMSHELGHIFGVNHDGEGMEPPCNLVESKIMAPTNISILEWSDCSTQAFKIFFGSGNASCLRKSPPEEIPPLFLNSLGSWLSIGGQCNNIYRYSDGACYLYKNATIDICNNYGCNIYHSCVNSTHGAYDGSRCGEGKYCLGYECKSIN